MKKTVVSCLLALVSLCPFSASARQFVVGQGEFSGDLAGCYYFVLPDQSSVRAFAAATGLYPGDFPAVVDTEQHLWFPLHGRPVSEALAEFSESNPASRFAPFFSSRKEARNESKSPSLKQAENKLIKFLRDEGAIAAGAVEATADQIDAMFANWEATLNDAQLDKKSAKYDRLLRAVERRGGTESGARYH